MPRTYPPEFRRKVLADRIDPGRLQAPTTTNEGSAT
jgi:hypothetical protein